LSVLPEDLISNLARSVIDPSRLVQALAFLHGKALEGFPGQPSARELAARFAKSDGGLRDKIDQLIKSELITSATVGFATGLGGILTLPLSLPGNLAANYFIQLRMASAIAVLCSLEADAPAVRALAMLCLSGDEARGMLEKIGIQYFVLPREEAMAKVTQAVGSTLTDAVARRILAKITEKSTASVGRAIPLFGGVVSAGVDAYYTRAVGKAAKEIFLHTGAVSS
jgi:hypothetical protein